MDSKFGEMIKAKRQEKELSLRFLSGELGIAPSYMCDIEKGRRYPPNKEMISKISTVLVLNEEDTNTLYVRP